jgi:hypothetical protein
LIECLIILHELRHKNILEKKQLQEAQPKWVKENPRGIDYAKERAFTTQKGPEITEHPGVKYKELEKGFIPEHYLTGHELFNWFMDARKFGTPKGKDWYPYFDKILKDHWEPHAKEIDKRSMELKSKPEHLGLAGGGLAGQLHLNQGGEAMPEHLTKVETNILKDKGFWIRHHGEILDARIGGMEAVKRGGREQDPKNVEYIFEQFNEFIKYGGDPTNYINDEGDSINFKERIENLKTPIPETRSADRGLSNILRV